MPRTVRDNLLAASVEHGHGLGWSFTPLNGKRPTLKGWQSLPRESLDQAQQWASQGNVGLRTGRTSGIVVIDADPGADMGPLALPGTVAVLTGRPGARHLYFRYDGPLGNSAGKLAPHVDVKADGGQVVFPGSTHPETGATYTWANGLSPWEITPAELPAHIIERLRADPPQPQAPRRPPPPLRQGTTTQDRYAAMALRLELNSLYTAPQGQRNQTLNKAAFSLGTLIGGGYLQRCQVEQSLQSAAEAVGLDGKETAATIRSGIEAGMKEPRTIPDKPHAPPVHVETEQSSYEPVPALPRGQFRLDLYGNADRFVHLFGRDVHWCEEHGKWYVWDGRCWRPDAVREMSRMAERTMQALVHEARGDEDAAKWAARCNRSGTPAKEMLEVIKHRTALASTDLDRSPWLLGVANGVIDLRTGELLEHDRKYLITVLSPVVYDADGACSRWDRFLLEIMAGDEEMAAALQRLAGYFLTGDISVQILPIVYGPGGNGKNVFLDTLMGILGPYAAEAPDGLVTTRKHDEHPTEIADLAGRRLVVASETEEGKKMRVGLVKKLTGNKYLKARFMRQDYFQFERTHKTVLVTNNKPIVTETSNAIWRRLRLIPFEVTIPEDRQDRQLTERLVAEWPGILAWAVRGCLQWQQRQCDLDLPGLVRQATAEYRNDSDHVGDFIAERCVDWRKHPEQKMRTPKERMYTAYCSWCRDAGEDVLTRTAFGNRMRMHGFADKAAKLDGDTKARKCWMDLTLTGESHA